MKTLIQSCALAVAALGLSTPVLAAWPEKPITLIVPAAPGGTTDITARLLSEKLGAALGTTVVVENRAGAAGIIGTQALLRSAPDGYTIDQASPKELHARILSEYAMWERVITKGNLQQ